MIGGTVQMQRQGAADKAGPFKFDRNRGARASTSKTEIEFEGVCVFAKKPQANEQTGCRPEKGKLRAPLHANQKTAIAAVQKKIDKGSIVMTIAPILKIGVTLKAITAHRPAVGLNKRRPK